jgi:hypothetical protein
MKRHAHIPLMNELARAILGSHLRQWYLLFKRSLTDKTTKPPTFSCLPPQSGAILEA